jgi:tetratricopeptide (TPR) repeat protein
VPRWRSVAQTLELELSFPAVERMDPEPWQLDLLNRRLEAFRSNRSESFAMELLGTQRGLGLTGFADDADDLLASIGRIWPLDSPNEELVRGGVLSPVKSAAAEISRIRRRLIQDPRRAIEWSELARNYAILGLHKRARRACLAAIQLAPDSRYILRSASCFFSTVGEDDRAWELLHRAINVDRDPWLKSAELALGRSLKKSPNGVRQARNLLDEANFSPRDLSELSSEVGTFEMVAGSRRSRRHFQEALVNPTENALAQVQWASKKDSDLIVVSAIQDQASASEANCLSAQREGDWEVAIREARAWQLDQPFSPGAAQTISCLLAAGLEDWNGSVEEARIGLISNPDDVILHNNAAYALIEMGDLIGAESELSMIDIEKISNYEYVAVSATWGLLLFRGGFVDQGRRRYEIALDIARNLPHREWETMALVMFAREEILLGSDAAREILSKAERAASRTDNALINRWLKIDTDLLERNKSK